MGVERVIGENYSSGIASLGVADHHQEQIGYAKPNSGRFKRATTILSLASLLAGCGTTKLQITTTYIGAEPHNLGETYSKTFELGDEPGIEAIAKMPLDILVNSYKYTRSRREHRRAMCDRGALYEAAKTALRNNEEVIKEINEAECGKYPTRRKASNALRQATVEERDTLKNKLQELLNEDKPLREFVTWGGYKIQGIQGAYKEGIIGPEIEYLMMVAANGAIFVVAPLAISGAFSGGGAVLGPGTVPLQ